MPITGTVRERMTSLADFPHVDQDAALRDVFAMLKDKFDAAEQFRSVLVFDAAQRPVGRLTLHQLLRSLLPDYLVRLPGHFEGGGQDVTALALLWQEDSAAHCRKAANDRVRNHMLPIASPLSPEDPLTLALYRIAVSDYNMIPVAEGGRVIGVIRIVDLLTTVTATVLAERGAE
jgi:CBS-domain-containing membrane protein